MSTAVSPASAPIAATVMVLTHNAAATLLCALASVGDFAEVIVCDGCSIDDTVEIARRHGAVVVEQDRAFVDAAGRLHDFAGARHQVVQLATQPWIFHLDADEMTTPRLVAAIAALVARDDRAVVGYECHARHIVGDAVVRSAANYPMRFLRIFRREAVVGYSGPINENPEFAPGARIDVLDEYLLIPMPPLSTVLCKWARYQRIVARDARDTDFASWWRTDLPEQWRATKWLAWRTWRSHRSEPGPRLPLRYDSTDFVTTSGPRPSLCDPWSEPSPISSSSSAGACRRPVRVARRRE